MCFIIVLIIIFILLLLFFIHKKNTQDIEDIEDTKETQNIEGFNSDANFNPLFVLDGNYVAFDNLYNPYKLFTETLQFKSNPQASVTKTKLNYDDYNEYVNTEKKINLTSDDLKNIDKYKRHKNKITKTSKDLIKNKFYEDWRYPEMPIDIDFLRNPCNYCEKNPIMYPCATYYSRWTN